MTSPHPYSVKEMISDFFTADVVRNGWRKLDVEAVATCVYELLHLQVAEIIAHDKRHGSVFSFEFFGDAPKCIIRQIHRMDFNLPLGLCKQIEN